MAKTGKGNELECNTPEARPFQKVGRTCQRSHSASLIPGIAEIIPSVYLLLSIRYTPLDHYIFCRILLFSQI